eukprot:scaffold18821_cov51-Attheya_sp.AAC.4
MPSKEGAIIMQRENPGQSMHNQPSQPRYGPPGHGAHGYRDPRGLPPHPLAGYPPHMPPYNYPPHPQPQPSHQGDGDSNYLRRMAGGSDLVQDARGQGELAMLRRQQPEPRHYDERGGYAYSERQPPPPYDEMRRAGHPQQPLPRAHAPHYPPPQTRMEGPPRSEGYHQSMNVARNDSHPGGGGMDVRAASYESRAMPDRAGEQNYPSRNRENEGVRNVSHPYNAAKPLPPANADRAKPQFLADRKTGHSSSTQKIPSVPVKKNDADEDAAMMSVKPTENMENTSTPPPLPPISDNKKDDDNDSGEKSGGMYDHALLLAQVSAIAHGEFKKEEEESESKDGKALPTQTSHPRPTYDSPSTPKKRIRNSPEFFESDTSVQVTPHASTPKQVSSNDEQIEISPGVQLTPTIPWQQRRYQDYPATAPGRNRTWSGEVPRRHRRVISGSENVPPYAMRLQPAGVYTAASEMSRARARAAWKAKHRPPRSNQNRDVTVHEGESGLEVEYQRTGTPSPTGSGSTVSFAVGSSASSGLSSFASAVRSDPGRYIHGQRQPRYTGSEPGHPYGRASARSSGGALPLGARPQYSQKEGDTRMLDEQQRHQGPYLQERDPSYYRAVPPPGYNFHRGERYEQHSSEPPVSQRSQSEALRTHGSQPYAHETPMRRGAPARRPISDPGGMGGVPPPMRYEGGTPNVTPSPAKHSDVPLDRRYFAGAGKNALFPMEGAYNRGEQYYQDQTRKRNVQFMQEAHQEQERMSSGDYPPSPGSYSDHESHLGDPSSPAGSQGGYPPYPPSSERGPPTTAPYDHYNYPPHRTEKGFRREDIGAQNRQYWFPRLPYSAVDKQALLAPDENSSAQIPLKTILRKKFAWKQFPELEAFLIAHREEYLEHSALNYTVQQKRYNNRLTEELLELAARHNYIFDEELFSFVSVRDRIRCYYKSYVQSSKKKGILIGYGSKKKLGLLPPRGDQDDGTKDTGGHDVEIPNEDESQMEEGDNESSEV